MEPRPGRLLAGALLTLAVAAPAASATEVSVRIAGETAAAQLGPATVDTQATGTFGPDSCPNDSAGGAIDLAVKQNWDRRAFTQTILGESHTFTRNDAWAFWINETYAQVGVCGYVPKAGDRILMIAGTSDPTTFAPTPTPLSLGDVPTDATVGEPFTILVRQHTSPDGVRTVTGPAAGVRVEVGSQVATTGADGRASFTFDRAGRFAVEATRAGNVSTDPVQLSVAPAEDTDPPAVGFGNVRDGERFTKGTAPRRLRGSAEDLGGPVQTVRISLQRRAGGRCRKLTTRGRFNASCSRNPEIALTPRSASGRWTLPLPKLEPGRYVARAVAIDASDNRGPAERVRFRVVR